MDNNNKLAVAIRRRFIPYKLTDDQIAEICKVINAFHKHNKNAFQEMVNQMDDDLLSLSGKYLRDNNSPIESDMENIFHHTLLRMRFYTTCTSVENAITSKDKIKEKEEQKKMEEEKILEYLQKHLTSISTWEGSTTSMLLYHVKQATFFAYQVKFFSNYKKLPWNKLVFYMQQYYKYFTSPDKIHLLQIGYISIKNLKTCVDLFKNSIENLKNKIPISKKKPSSKKPNGLQSNLDTKADAENPINDLYNNIRDIYVLEKMEMILEGITLKSIHSNLRQLQVLGENIKSTELSPNISQTLLGYLDEYFTKDCIQGLKKLRNTISHLSRLPQLSDEVTMEIKLLLCEISFVFHSIIPNYRSILANKIKNVNTIDVELPCCYTLLNTANLSSALAKDLNFTSYPFKAKPPIERIDRIQVELDKTDTIEYSYCLEMLEHILKCTPVDQRELEIVLLIMLKNLDEEQHILNQNNEWFLDKYPILTGKQLRNHLAHGDPIVELLGIDTKMAVNDTARLLTENNEQKDQRIQKITESLPINDLHILDTPELNRLSKMANLFESILNGTLEKVQTVLDTIDEEWIEWRNPSNFNMLQLAAQNRNDDLELFEFIYNNTHDLFLVLDDRQYTIAQLGESVGNVRIVKRIYEIVICYFLAEACNLPINMAATFSDYNISNVKDIVQFLASRKKRYIMEMEWNFWTCLSIYGICCDDDSYLQKITQLLYYKTFKDIDETSPTCHTACIFGATNVVQYLINTGYNLNLATNKNETALAMAIEYKRNDIKLLLLKNGAAVYDEHLNNEDKTLIASLNSERHQELWECIKLGDVNCFQKFLINGRELLGPTRMADGWNCMHFAVLSDNPDMIKEIYLQFPHLLNTSDKNRKTPLDLAIERNCYPVLDIILQLVCLQMLQI